MKSVCAVVLMLAAGIAAATQAPSRGKPDPDAVPEKSLAYDGAWWDSVNKDRRDGFFWGAGDCLRWDAHVPRGYLGAGAISGASFDREITTYYKNRPGDQKLPVVEVWRKTAGKMVNDTAQVKGGEVNRKPHGFLDGLWYRQSSWNRRYGFLNGYLGCLRTYVGHPTAMYSRSVTYYDDHIWDYVDAHPKADDEAIADILYSFRDVPKSN